MGHPTPPDHSVQGEEKLGWHFPGTFWYANGAELCERAAYYGMFITLMRYLNQDIGFSDVETGWISASFASILYFLPVFMGIMADKIGFKTALMIAFALLTGGYGLLGAYQLKATALVSLTLIMFGGAIIKPVISGTVAKCSDSLHRARAMSIFYMVVNIGSFSGKALAGELNEVLGLRYINFYAAGMCFVALILITVFYKNVDTAGTGKTVGEALRGLGKVMLNFRFLSLILIIGGFWAIQGQLYATMPTYIERLLGKGYKPEWLANINPLVVVILVVPITNMIRKVKPVNAIGIGLFIIPFTALVIALGSTLQGSVGDSVDLGFCTVHPLVLMFIVGIALQGLAECFLSPKWLEFASKQAPKDEVGLYLGYSHLTTFFAWFFGFILAGYLLSGLCPDPKTFSAEKRHQWRLATDPAYVFTLDDQSVQDLATADRLPPSVLSALTDHGFDLSAEAQLNEETEDALLNKDPEQKWNISDDETNLTIQEERFEIETDGQPQNVSEFLVLGSVPRVEEERPPLPAEYANARYIWYAFFCVGIIAFLGLLLFKFVTGRIDRRRELESGGAS